MAPEAAGSFSCGDLLGETLIRRVYFILSLWENYKGEFKKIEQTMKHTRSVLILVLLISSYLGGQPHRSIANDEVETHPVKKRIPESGTIVWSTKRHGTWEIYKMRADGTDRVRLTYNDASDYHPVWSNDGQWIYFCRIDASESEDICRMRPDGSGFELIKKDASPFFDITHDDAKIVYASSDQNRSSIILYDIEKKTSELIFPVVALEFADKILAYPTISEDGNWLAFASNITGPLSVNLCALDGSIRYLYDYGCQPQYHPDGSWIVWITNVVHELCIGSADGEDKRVFEDSILGRPHNYFPRWSNDGQYVVFAASPEFDWDSDYEIFLKPFDGGEAVRLTYDPAPDSWPDLFFPFRTLTLSSGYGGTTEPSIGEYVYFDSDSEVSIRAIPDEGFTFSHWSGDASGSLNPITVRMDTDKSIMAYFSRPSSREEGGESDCFIATACYGTPMADEVRSLTAFRDRYLLTIPEGKAFIDIYQKISPGLVDFIKDREQLKMIIRICLKPFVWAASFLEHLDEDKTVDGR